MSCKCKFSHDISFCEGKGCDLKETCRRYLGNHEFEDWVPVTLSDFWSHDRGFPCSYYWMYEEEEDDDQSSGGDSEG